MSKVTFSCFVFILKIKKIKKKANLSLGRNRTSVPSYNRYTTRDFRLFKFLLCKI